MVERKAAGLSGIAAREAGGGGEEGPAQTFFVVKAFNTAATFLHALDALLTLLLHSALETQYLPVVSVQAWRWQR